MRIRNKAILGWLAGCLWMVSTSQALTEQDALYRALKNNIDISVTRLQLAADSLSWLATRAGRLPTLDLEGSADYAPLDKSTYGGVTTDNSKDLSAGAAATATQVLPGGATISAGADQNASWQKMDFDSAGYTTKLSVSITQPLLKNAWSNAPFDYTLQVEKLNHEQFSLSQKKQLLSTLSTVRSRYWSWYEKKQLLNIAGQNLEYSRKQMAVARQKFRVGQATELDTLSAALDALQSQQSQMNATADEASARRDLAVVLSTTPDSLELANDLTVTVADLPPAETFLSLVEAYDPQLRIFAVAREKLKLEEKKRRADFWPSLSASGSYSHSLAGDTLFSDNTSSSQNALVSLILSYSLPTTQARVNAAQNRLSQEENDLEREKYRRDLVNKVTELVDSWQLEKARLEIMAISRTVAQKQLDAAQKGYQLGTVDRLALEKAQNDFTQVAVLYFQALVSLKRLEITFDEMSGQILKKFGVNL